MRLTLRASFILMVAVFWWGSTAALAAFTPADSNSCSIQLQDPHPSLGAPGIVAKADWRCNDTSPNKSIYYALYLYMCPSQDITKDYEWLTNHCTGKGFDYDPAMPMTQDGGLKTRYVPPGVQPGASGSGWWVAEAIWISSHAEGSNPSAEHVKFSNLKHLTYP